MKVLISVLAICFSLCINAQVQSVNQEFILDDRDALEFGFPNKLILKTVEIQLKPFSDSQVRIIGSADEQKFDLVDYIKKIGPYENGMYPVKVTLWEDSVGGEECEEEVSKSFVIRFKVSRHTNKSSGYRLKAKFLHTPNNCEESAKIREFSYSLIR